MAHGGVAGALLGGGAGTQCLAEESERAAYYLIELLVIYSYNQKLPYC